MLPRPPPAPARSGRDRTALAVQGLDRDRPACATAPAPRRATQLDVAVTGRTTRGCAAGSCSVSPSVSIAACASDGVSPLLEQLDDDGSRRAPARPRYAPSSAPSPRRGRCWRRLSASARRGWAFGTSPPAASAPLAPCPRGTTRTAAPRRSGGGGRECIQLACRGCAPRRRPSESARFSSRPPSYLLQSPQARRIS